MKSIFYQASNSLFVFALGLSALTFENFATLIHINIILAILLYLPNIFLNKIFGKNYPINTDFIYAQISFIILAFLIFNDSNWIIFSSMAVIALADFISVIIGSSFSTVTLKINGEQKSILSLIAFAAISIVVLFFIGSTNSLLTNKIFLFGFDSVKNFSVAVFIISTTITFFYYISPKGIDKFLVPLVTAFFIHKFSTTSGTELLNGYLIGMLLAAFVAGVSYRVKFLTLDGAFATFLLAGFIFGLGGLKWSVPMLTFFILSSLLSKLRRNINDEVEVYFEKTGVRDKMQVVANGGLGGVLVILYSLYYNELYYLLYLSTLAAVCADTWATEIGTWRKTATYNILNFKPAVQGISGGISFQGTIGTFLGAGVIAISGLFWINFDFLPYLFIIIFAGIVGSFFDSFLGATIQAQHQCVVCEKITEKTIHCGKEARHYRGLGWINNDTVNLFSGFAGALVILLFKSLVNL